MTESWGAGTSAGISPEPQELCEERIQSLCFSVREAFHKHQTFELTSQMASHIVGLEEHQGPGKMERDEITGLVAKDGCS